MRIFVLKREEDESGVSGTGIVAEGIEFGNGKCVLSWRGEPNSMGVFGDIAAVEKIHGHRGKTKVVFLAEVLYNNEGSIIDDDTYINHSSVKE